MNIEELQGLGVFASATPQMRKVKLGDREIEVGVEELSFIDAVRLRGEKELHEFYPILIARCIHFEDGKKMSVEQACKLTKKAMQAFLDVIGEVNGADPNSD